MITALLLLGATSTSGQEGVPPGEDPEALFQEGNQLYQEGDFPGALSAYENVLEAGYHSHDLYYNLGNTYFKTGALGRSILSYERALSLNPRNADAQANLDLARSLTVDEIEPLPRFWVLSALSWWVDLFPRGILIFLVVATYLASAAGLCIRILSREAGTGRMGSWALVVGGAGLLLFGSTLLAREEVIASEEWGIILVEEVAVQSAPSEEDDLTLFRIHEGAKVRLDQHTDLWSEVVLEDGKVGWVPTDVFEII